MLAVEVNQVEKGSCWYATFIADHGEGVVI